MAALQLLQKYNIPTIRDIKILGSSLLVTILDKGNDVLSVMGVVSSTKKALKNINISKPTLESIVTSLK